jgi:phage gp29-like protein
MSLPSKLSTEVASIKRDINYPLYGGDRIIHPDEVLQRRGNGQYKAYDDLRKDGHCQSVLQKRELAVIAREWEIKPGGTSALDKKAADMVKYHLQSLGDRTEDLELGVGGFDLSCLNFLDAILKGFSVGETMWGQDNKEIYPTEIKPRNQQRFIFGLSDKGSYELRLLTPENSDGEKIGTLYPRKFITHSFGAKDGNPYGMGLGQTLWFPVFFKRQDIKFWLTFVDKFASPTALGKYKQGATEQQKRILLAALDAIAHDAGVIVPEGMEIMLMEASRSGSIECYESLAIWTRN